MTAPVQTAPPGHTNSGGAGLTTQITFAAPTTPGNTVVLRSMCRTGGTAITGVADDGGNAWTPAYRPAWVADFIGEVWICDTTVTMNTITVTYAAAGNARIIEAGEWPGNWDIPTSPGTCLASSNSASGANPTRLNVLPTASNAVVVGMAAQKNGATVVAAAPFTQLDGATGFAIVSGSTMAVGSAYKQEVGAAANDGVDWTYSSGANPGMQLAYTMIQGSASVPSAPTAVSASPGNAQATVSYTPSGNNGGSAVTGYTATLNPGNHQASVGSGGGPITVTGLTNGTTYTATVHATNAIGNSPESGASNPVTPSSVTQTVPSAPIAVSAAAGNAQAVVSFSAPASNGGSPILGYVVTANPGGATGFVSGATPAPVTVIGLANGTSYTFTVHATNAVGDSAESSPSNAVVPGFPVQGSVFILKSGVWVQL